MIEFHIEAVVDLLEPGFRNIDALLPDAEVFLVAGLEPHQLVLAGLVDGGIGFGRSVDVAIDPHQFGDGIGCKSLVVEQGFPAVQDHSELRAPVADVVVGDDLEAEKAGDAADGISEDGRADVADVHRLGDVRRGEIDNHTLAFSRFRGSEARVLDELFGVAGVGFREDREIDEARAIDLGGGEAVDPDLVENFLGEGAGIGLSAFRQNHCGVGLVVAETEVGGGCNVGMGGLAIDGLEGGCEA